MEKLRCENFPTSSQSFVDVLLSLLRSVASAIFPHKRTQV